MSVLIAPGRVAAAATAAAATAAAAAAAAGTAARSPITAGAGLYADARAEVGDAPLPRRDEGDGEVGEQRDAGEAKDDGYGGSGAGAERGDDRG